MRVTWEMVQKRTSVTSSCCAGHTPTPHSFFFHAEDGIRDGRVTGVQTCALPISNRGELIKNQPHHEEIYVAHKNGKAWGEPKKLGPTINTEFNDAAASLSPDGKTMFLYYEENGGDIFSSTFDGKDWSKPVPLNKNINTSVLGNVCERFT